MIVKVFLKGLKLYSSLKYILSFIYLCFINPFREMGDDMWRFLTDDDLEATSVTLWDPRCKNRPHVHILRQQGNIFRIKSSANFTAEGTFWVASVNKLTIICEGVCNGQTLGVTFYLGGVHSHLFDHPCRSLCVFAISREQSAQYMLYGVLRSKHTVLTTSV